MTLDITIRPPELTDVDDLFEIQQQSRYVWGTLQVPYMTRAAVQARAEQRDPNLNLLVAEVEGKVVGQISVRVSPRPRKKHVGGLGMGVHDDYHGRGVGTALMTAIIDLADLWLQVTRLELEVYTDNEPALALYRKFGFVEEGILRKNAFREGEYVDSMLMARLKPALFE